jgi:hypothetical protein
MEGAAPVGGHLRRRSRSGLARPPSRFDPTCRRSTRCDSRTTASPCPCSSWMATPVFGFLRDYVAVTPNPWQAVASD